MVERRGSLSGSETWEGNINASDVLRYTLRQRLPHTLRAMETTHWPSEKNNAEMHMHFALVVGELFHKCRGKNESCLLGIRRALSGLVLTLELMETFLLNFVFNRGITITRFRFNSQNHIGNLADSRAFRSLKCSEGRTISHETQIGHENGTTRYNDESGPLS